MQRSTKWLLSLTAIGSLITGVIFTLHGFGVNLTDSAPENLYLFLHILGVVAFLGNIIITGVWMIWAERSKNQDVIKFAVRGVNWADVFFTVPGVFLILDNGVILSEKHGGIGTSWITAALILFTISGIIWVLTLIPAQDKMVRMSTSAAALPKNFYNILHRWYFWGIVATILPLISLVLMVAKPKLW
ncbi:MAG TPA: DUF2269 family protein [Candidatus Saccharimonadales bacterium]|nr:DUF2269 family protein [Candidatus Saccharimonadales bacterium]